MPQDDYFTANRHRVIQLLKDIKGLNIPDIEMQFTNGININSLNEEILDAMIGNGTKMLTLALESGSDYVQKNIIKKNVDLEKAKEIVKLCREKKIITRCSVIFGFPGETKELMQETVAYLNKMGADWYIVIKFAPLIGSELYYYLKQNNYIKESVEFWSNTGFQDRSFDLESITAAELEQFTYRLNLELNFINNVNLTSGNYDRAILLFQDIINNYPFHIFGWFGLFQAYNGLNNLAEANKAKQRIIHLINTDIRSKEMYSKHGDLLSGVVSQKEFKNSF